MIAKTNRPPESITLHPRMRYAICRDQVVYEVKHTGAETWFDIPVTEDATLPPWRVLITNGRETYQVDIDPTWLPD